MKEEIYWDNIGTIVGVKVIRSKRIVRTLVMIKMLEGNSKFTFEATFAGSIQSFTTTKYSDKKEVKEKNIWVLEEYAFAGDLALMMRIGDVVQERITKNKRAQNKTRSYKYSSLRTRYNSVHDYIGYKNVTKSDNEGLDDLLLEAGVIDYYEASE